MQISLPALTFFPLLVVCFFVGYWVALLQAKRTLSKEIKDTIEEIRRSENIRLQ